MALHLDFHSASPGAQNHVEVRRRRGVCQRNGQDGHFTTIRWHFPDTLASLFGLKGRRVCVNPKIINILLRTDA